jgi:hypothetical protein
MTELRLGDRVITAAKLDQGDWNTDASRRRLAGHKGTVRNAYPTDAPNRLGVYRLILDNVSELADYYGDELTPIREVARPAGEETPEQRWRERMVHRLGELEQKHRSLAAAIAGELREFELRIEALEPDTEPVEEQSVADPETMAGAWMALQPHQRERIQAAMLRCCTTERHEHLRVAESALVAAPGLLADIGALRRQLAEADREIEGLRAGQRELEESSVFRRNAEALQILRAGFDLRPGCCQVNEAAEDAAGQLHDYHHAVNEALGYDGADGPTPEQALVDIETARAREKELEKTVAHHCERAARAADRAAANKGAAAELRRVISALDKALHLPGCEHPVDKLVEETCCRLRLYDRLTEAYGEADPNLLAVRVLAEHQELDRLRAERHLAAAAGDLIEALGRRELSSAADGLGQLARYSELGSEELIDALVALADDGDDDARCPAARLSELCEALLQAITPSPEQPDLDSEPGPERSRR